MTALLVLQETTAILLDKLQLQDHAQLGITALEDPRFKLQQTGLQELCAQQEGIVLLELQCQALVLLGTLTTF